MTAVLEFCLPHQGKPRSSPVSQPHAPTPESTWVHIPRSGASQMTVSQRPGFVLNWIILVFADLPAGLSWGLRAFS